MSSEPMVSEAKVTERLSRLLPMVATAESELGKLTCFVSPQGEEQTFHTLAAIVAIHNGLIDAGARVDQVKTRDPLSLSDLATLDTEDGRELLSLLSQAQAVAERIDAARGRCLPDHIPLQPGESRGTDLAETISMIAVRVRREIVPPKGRGE